MLYVIASALILTAASAQTVYVPAMGRYPGYTGDQEVSGHITGSFSYAGDGKVGLYYRLSGVEPECAKPDLSVGNSCGIHIHEGFSCETADLPGGHYYNKDKIAEDPWLNASYISGDPYTNDPTYASGSVEVVFGFTYDQTKGRALVVHDRAGKRISCALLAPTVVFIADLGKYPGYNGNVSITGRTSITFLDDRVEIIYMLGGVEKECSDSAEGVANSCGIHFHEGTSCDTAAAPGGHYYNKDLYPSDPWAAVVYKAHDSPAGGPRANGQVGASYGYNYAETRGHVLVIHDRSGARVTCAVIPKQESKQAYTKQEHSK